MILELSARNPRVADVRRLLRQKAQRRRTSRFVVETPKLVLEAFDSGLSIDHVIVPGDQHPDPDIAARCESRQVRIFGLDAGAFQSLADARSPQPALAVVSAPSLDVDDRFSIPNSLILVLVDIADPGNVGTLLRTAEATGCAGVIVTTETADVLSPKVVRASAGSMLRVPIGEVPSDDLLARLEAFDGQIVATAMDGVPYYSADFDSDRTTILLLGNEAHGLAPATLEMADHVVSIPMQGDVESLNVATAGAVLAFDQARRRR